MGVGIFLGCRPHRDDRSVTPTKWLERIDSWFVQHASDDLISHFIKPRFDEIRTLHVVLHPAEEPVEVFWESGDKLRFSARTSSAGPGYHVFLVDLLKQLATSLRLQWQAETDPEEPGDETDYFESGGVADVMRSMDEWLQAVLRRLHELGGGCQYLSMPLSPVVAELGSILTQVGPRDRAWAAGGAKKPSLAHDFWPWPEVGKTGRYWLGKALVEMWMNVRWREPVSEAETRLAEKVCSWLDFAYELDPNLPMPWREWAELLDDHDLQSKYEGHIRPAATTVSGPLIGYRRHDLGEELAGGWRVQIPGSLYSEYDNDGTWHAWDASRGIWFSAYSREEGALSANERVALTKAELSKSMESFIEDNANASRAAYIERTSDDDGDDYFMLRGRVATASKLAIVTVCFDELTDKDWALGIWRSIRCD
jgi:hypothetical protein